MRTIKLKFVANKLGNWKSLPEKIADLKKWATGIDLQIDLQYTTFENIPFSNYNNVIMDQYNTQIMSTQYKGVDFVWYDKNISSKAKGYDIVLFALSLDQWPLTNARGWRTDKNNGPVELQVASNEKDYMDSYNSFLMYAKHEISHALYMIAEQTDKTHDYFYNGDFYCKKIWSDLKFKEPNWVDDPTMWQTFLTLLWYFFNKKTIVKEAIPEIEPEIELTDEPLSPEYPKATLDNLCLSIQRHEGWYDGSRSWRNRNPGNLRYVGQRSAVGADKSNFAIFATYQDGFNTLKEMVRRASVGLSKVYSPENTLLDFFNIYAPVSDNNDSNRYANVVASELGVDISFKIKDLIV